MDQIADGLHGYVARRQFVGTALQFPDDELGIFNILLILHLVFQAGPGIHGDGPQLDFRIKAARIGTGYVFIRRLQF